MAVCIYDFHGYRILVTNVGKKKRISSLSDQKNAISVDENDKKRLSGNEYSSFYRFLQQNFVILRPIMDTAPFVLGCQKQDIT